MTRIQHALFFISLVFGGSGYGALNTANSANDTILSTSLPENALIYNAEHERNTFIPLVDLYSRFEPENVASMIVEIKKHGINHMQLSKVGIEVLSRKLVTLCSPEQFEELITLNVVNPDNPDTYALSLVVENTKEDWIIEKFEILRQRGIPAQRLLGKMNVRGEVYYTAPMDHAARFGYAKVVEYLADQSAQIQSLEMAWLPLLMEKPEGYIETARHLIKLGYPPAQLKSILQKIVDERFVLEEPELTAMLQPYI
ncbi:hypothetical protein [Alteromonas lipolytica]|uniref:Uncharacterized protein n=1 Tax=Alteromonas lipolytica TaxID=1856405 RepID=A0A1E8FFJ4_9ALTE|nr:hypothetical protein [Alteromonas lipolytica]OFI34368.1 hypothetical protein BFC17_18460 [Alteromonas lipolytica]GGF82082.1 hypothetical protein GCM10011338_37920 [Alteromonas lipolytica]